MKREMKFDYESYDASHPLPEQDRQLVEAAINLVIFSVLIMIQNRGAFKGRTIYCYFIMYPVCRFILEFFRGDPERGFIGPLSVSQWISLIFLFIGVKNLLPVFHKKHTKIF